MTELHTNDIHLNVLSQRRTTSTDTDTVSTIEEENYPDGGWKAYLVLCGSFLGLVVNMGLINSIGAIQAYVSTHQLAGVAASSVAWIFSIYLALAYAIGIFIGPIFDRHGALELLVIATILLFAGLMGTASSTTLSSRLSVSGSETALDSLRWSQSSTTGSSNAEEIPPE